jgi:hypothetical protein
MRRFRIVKLLLVNAVGVLLSSPLFAVDYKCVPVEVAIFDNRAHVACADPGTRWRPGTYPVDHGDAIQYLAVPLSEQQWADQFIRLANIAETSGLVMQVSFDSGDYTGDSFGCDRRNCRRAKAVTLMKTAFIP